jgi:hypothetical protein
MTDGRNETENRVPLARRVNIPHLPGASGLLQPPVTPGHGPGVHVGRLKITGEIQDVFRRRTWIPAFAGMTDGRNETENRVPLARRVNIPHLPGASGLLQPPVTPGHGPGIHVGRLKITGESTGNTQSQTKP